MVACMPTKSVATVPRYPHAGADSLCSTVHAASVVQYKRSSARSPLVSCENCSTGGCIFDVFVKRGGSTSFYSLAILLHLCKIPNGGVTLRVGTVAFFFQWYPLSELRCRWEEGSSLQAFFMCFFQCGTNTLLAKIGAVRTKIFSVM